MEQFDLLLLDLNLPHLSGGDVFERLTTRHPFLPIVIITGLPQQYPPAMMLALLIYSYATGRFGSRTIEAATHSHVAVRYICAHRHPDHHSICTFHTANEPAFVAAFTHVLQLAHPLRLTQVGRVSVDETSIAAHASKHAAVSSQRVGEMIAPLELEVQDLLSRAKAAEAQETPVPGLDLPAELRRRESRVAALQRARAVIAERARQVATEPQPAYEAKVAAGQALYRLRKQTVEPVFGIIKEVMGFRRFLLRGRGKVSLE